VATVDLANDGTLTTDVLVNGKLTADSIITGGARYGDGSVQTTALISGEFQSASNTNSYDATRTYVQSMGYLRGTNNVVSATVFQRR
jgi:hypothetical protein